MNDETLFSSDIVDFIIRKDAYYEPYILEDPGLIYTHTIKDTFTICYAREADYQRMIGYMGTDFINSTPNILGLLQTEGLEASGILEVQQQPYLNLYGREVLIGFIDTGIDYTQEVFQYEDRTSKIRYIYDQSIPGNPPEGFPLGTEYTNEQINAALASETPYETVPHRDESGHGTFLASVASGRRIGNFTGAAPDSEIIMVKLKKAYPFYLNRFSVPSEQENAFETSFVMLGVEYIIKKSVELNRPVVICIGLGSNFDNHDGYGPLEEYLFSVSNIPGICVCVAVGNESQARHHYSQRFTQAATPENIDIRVGENAGDVFVVVTNKICDRFSVSVRSPTGELVGRIPAKAGYTFTTGLVLEQSQVSISYYFPVAGSGDQLTLVKIMDATPGVWTITVYGDIIIDGSINAWLPITGFVSPTVEFLSSDPYNTITAPATGYGIIHCGAYNSSRDSLYPNSSWGPTRLSFENPDLVAPGYQIGGFYPTGYGYMDGTSAAAAITAGASALLLQWSIVEGNDFGFCTPLIKAYLIRGCNRTDLIEYPSSQWGYGSLNLLQTFFYMREL
ncbi:MAG: peptidase [Clostridiales bacterium]|nr:peptidase [Clostridiales bacterium]